jgi:hypothetical protein
MRRSSSPWPPTSRRPREAQALIDEINTNPSVASLASNPLMLTIIALIKQKNVKLPQRRVELYETAVNTLLRSWNQARSLSGLPLGAEPRLNETKRVWAAVAHWMHAETSRGTLHRRQLQQKLVEVLQDEADLSHLAAETEAESYLHAASESTGLLEARGEGYFAFVHQTFQEYLAADRLAIPPRKALDRIQEVAGNPRWHEVIRLAGGILGVFQRDTECLGELIDALLDSPDPLEPWFCSRLRLAAACIADDVGFRQAHVDRVIQRIAERLMELPEEWPVTGSLTDALRDITPPQPERMSRAAVDALCRLAGHSQWRPRMEAARKLAMRGADDNQAKEMLERLFGDDDRNVRAHAAVGLWRAGRPLEGNILDSVLYGLASPHAILRLSPTGELVERCTQALRNDTPLVAWYAAEALRVWGHQNDALPALLKLLSQRPLPDRTDPWRLGSGGWGWATDSWAAGV